jgi:mono/diheme cytochrome c family protein
MKRLLPLVALCLSLLISCDDMTSQPKARDYAPFVQPATPPADIVSFRSAPELPPALTAALMERGQVEYRAYCRPCHDEIGAGRGMVVQRGFPQPPSLLSGELRATSTQYLYDVISNGKDKMYGFGDRVASHDRWAIAAYVRALQASDNAKLADVAASERSALP